MAGSSITLPNLVEAFMNAIADAQDKIEQQTMDNINEWFDADGRPKMVTFRVPELSPDAHERREQGEETEHVLKVPLLTLMQNNPITIKRLVTKFEISLGGVVIERDDEEEEKPTLMGVATRRLQKVLSVDLFTGDERKGRKASMEIEFEQGEPTEAYLKLQNELLKLI